jgi:hypothetical protein
MGIRAGRDNQRIQKKEQRGWLHEKCAV